MATMLAMVSGILVGMTPLLILDAIGRHRFREVSFFAVTAVITAVACYISLNELPDSHGYPRYWNASCIFGIFVFGIFTAWSMPVAKQKRKR
jgi:peptidoglycan/LPS O-acetylase OafA/YrhL